MQSLLNRFKKVNNKDLDSDDKNILITSILIECAKSDHDFSLEEKTKIKALLKKKLNINDDKLNSVFTNALENVKDNIEIYSITKDIRNNFNKSEILEIFELMWSVILADGKVDDFEAALMTKLVGLFHLTGRESAEAKKKAMSRI